MQLQRLCIGRRRLLLSFCLISRMSLGKILKILLLEIFEDTAEISGLVRHILHDMRGEPHFLHAALLIDSQLLQTLFRVLEAIIHAREDVAMKINATREKLSLP